MHLNRPDRALRNDGPRLLPNGGSSLEKRPRVLDHRARLGARELPPHRRHLPLQHQGARRLLEHEMFNVQTAEHDVAIHCAIKVAGEVNARR